MKATFSRVPSRPRPMSRPVSRPQVSEMEPNWAGPVGGPGKGEKIVPKAPAPFVLFVWERLAPLVTTDLHRV